MTDSQLLPPPTPIESAPQFAASPIAPQAPRDRRRRWPWVLLGVGITVLALVALVVIGLVAAPSTLIDDDLNDGTGPFAHESDELVTLDFVDGGYAMILEPAPANFQVARSFWEPSERAVRVAASFEVREAGSQGYVVGIS